LIEEIVKSLEDGQWHTFKKIKENFSLSEEEFQEILNFLKKFGFIYVDEKEEKAKLDVSLLKLPV